MRRKKFVEITTDFLEGGGKRTTQIYDRLRQESNYSPTMGQLRSLLSRSKDFVVSHRERTDRGRYAVWVIK